MPCGVSGAHSNTGCLGAWGTGPPLARLVLVPGALHLPQPGRRRLRYGGGEATSPGLSVGSLWLPALHSCETAGHRGQFSAAPQPVQGPPQQALDKCQSACMAANHEGD